MATSADLETRIDQIRARIDASEFTEAARECAALIEFALRELYSRSDTQIGGANRAKAIQVEVNIGGARGKSFGDFTFGELVRLYRESGFLAAWAEANEIELRALQMINLDEIVRVRNKLNHDVAYEGSRNEANILFNALQIILETFGILSLASSPAQGQVSKASDHPDAQGPGTSTRTRGSAYSARAMGEAERLALQAQANRELDMRLLAQAVEGMEPQGLVALDLGCADGALTVDRFEALPQFDLIVGVDRDPELIEHAQSRSSERFVFLNVDLEALDFRDQMKSELGGRGLSPCVDVIFSALTLHHLASPVKLLRTCRYLLVEDGALVVRGSDDGSKLAYPDEESRVEQVIQITLAQAGVSDRLNGRKILSQLRRAGFRDVKIEVSVKHTGGLDCDERNALFRESFSYRRNYIEKRIADGDPAAVGQLETMNTLLEELELDFEDESFFYVELGFGGLGRN